MNKPVAIRYDFDGYGYQYMDSGSGSDWQTRVDGEPLYTHPVKEQVETIEYTCPNCQTHVGLHVTHPVKELTLTDEDILEEWTCKYSDCYQDTLIDFARAILRKAQEQ